MNNKEYKCAVCNTWHPDVISRANCEIECMKKKAEEERQAELRKKEAEYGKRKEEVDNAFNVAYELKEKFVADYGCYTYGWNSKNSDQPSIWRFFA
jgi:N12 class adenine-specific DNA methylase